MTASTNNYFSDRTGTTQSGDLQRKENITDASLAAFRTQYKDEAIEKEDIFFYTYGVLHSPEYRKRFADNLRRQLPRIPFAPDCGVVTGTTQQKPVCLLNKVAETTKTGR